MVSAHRPSPPRAAPKPAIRASSGSSKAASLGGIISAGAGLLAGATGAKRSSGRRRRRGVAYWANKVQTEKLKRRYFKLKYGGRS